MTVSGGIELTCAATLLAATAASAVAASAQTSPSNACPLMHLFPGQRTRHSARFLRAAESDGVQQHQAEGSRVHGNCGRSTGAGRTGKWRSGLRSRCSPAA